MKSIYKYKLKPYSVLMMPKDAKFLTVQVQRNRDVCLWALVDTDAPQEKRRIAILPTGRQVPDECLAENYIATFQFDMGALVFHAFDVTNTMARFDECVADEGLYEHTEKEGS